MLEKDLGSPKIKRLRVIHLIEADYNFVLKSEWGRQLVYHGEDHECFGQQQFARPGQQCIDAVHQKMLTYDLVRIMLIGLAVFNNDASGCFDRIVVSLGMMAAVRLNMPRNALRMHASILKRMKYFVKMTHGISQKYYKATRDYLLFGSGQGSGASPAMWLMIAVVLLTALTVLAPMMMCFMDPWHDLFDERNADAYVDDMAVGVSDAHMESAVSYQELAKNLQHTAQTWERILYSSRGVLNIKKCFWYLIHWEWHKGHPSMVTSVSTPAMIALTLGGKPVYEVVQRKEPWDVMHTLGV